ncbi:hypothetical protein, partial [Enterobacter hormaechei]
GKTLLHGDVLMWLMKTLLTSGCTNQRGAGQGLFSVNTDRSKQQPSKHNLAHTHNTSSFLIVAAVCHDSLAKALMLTVSLDSNKNNCDL